MSSSFEQSLKCRCQLHREFQQGHSAGTSAFFLTESKPHYGPDRFFDVEHIKLDIAVDLSQKLLQGTCTTEFQVVAPTLQKLTFDALDLQVEEVWDDKGGTLKFDQSSEKLTIFLKEPLKVQTRSHVTVKYKVQEPRAGLYFIAPTKDQPQRPWQLWTQGQDEDNRYWFPCHDAPNEKATTEMIVTVDEKYMALSNGKLLKQTYDAKARTRTFHWKQSIPHASYLVTLCVGEFVEIKDSWRNSKGEEIPVPYYTLSGREDETRQSFSKTPKMLDFFSKSIGVDYPYEQYAQVVAWDFIYGGMENTSSTTQTEYTLHPASLELDYSSEPLVAHELAHQWFGDLLTCKEWSHAWLNEGFATYFESLWMNFEHGKEEFLYEIFQNQKIYFEEDSGSYRRPIVTNVYLRPSDIFDRHLYEKGARVLHMLHRLVGNDLWWQAIKLYVTTNAQKTVETIDLQRAFETVTGRSLAWFFEQWVHKAGHPDVKATYAWDEEKKQVKISITQQQKADEWTPAVFRFPLVIKLENKDGEKVHEVEVSEREHGFWFSSSEKPKFVSLNCENTILGAWDFNPGRDLLIAQLQNDRDVMGRVFAARTLKKDASRQTVEALSQSLITEKFWGVQVEIAESLGSLGSPLAQKALLQSFSQLKHPKVRRAIMAALGNFRNEETFVMAEKALREDESPLVMLEAGTTIGKTRLPRAFETLINSLGKRQSWHDSYENGILQGLAELKLEPKVLPILMDHTKSSRSMFVRRTAVMALAKWGISQPTQVIDTLMQLTRDENFFVRLYAIHALETLGDSRAVAALKRVQDTVVDPRTSRAALVAIKNIRAGRSNPEALDKLKEDFDRLRIEYREILGRLETLEGKKNVL